MAKKYIGVGATGTDEEVEALQSSAGAADAGKIPGLDDSGRIDQSMMPVGVAADTKSLPATENLAGGDYVNIYDNAGTTSIRKADASAANAGKKAHGFVLAPVTTGSNGTVYFEGANTALSGLTGGDDQFLSATTPGAVTSTPPITSGHILQRLGVATGATEINTEIGRPVIRA
jgi:hypothetical protein